jgi:hypothetical protein
MVTGLLQSTLPTGFYSLDSAAVPAGVHRAEPIDLAQLGA